MVKKAKAPSAIARGRRFRLVMGPARFAPAEGEASRATSSSGDKRSTTRQFSSGLGLRSMTPCCRG